MREPNMRQHVYQGSSSFLYRTLTRDVIPAAVDVDTSAENLCARDCHMMT
jgi:hypothetical protein